MKSSSRLSLFAAVAAMLGGSAGALDNRGRTARARTTDIHPMITSPAHEIRDWNAKVDLAKKAKHLSRIQRAAARRVEYSSYIKG